MSDQRTILGTSLRVIADPDAPADELEIRLRGALVGRIELHERNDGCELAPGEKTVRAAAFALALRTYSEGYQTPTSEHAARAADDADNAVDALRSPTAGRYRKAMVQP